MQKLKILITASTLILIAVCGQGLLPRKGTGNLFHVVNGVCTLDITCALGAGEIQCVGLHYTTDQLGSCVDPVEASDTHVVTD